jgi:catechol 2,3-dioxygenase-like lactoylglutathione lyase family enzyme
MRSAMRLPALVLLLGCCACAPASTAAARSAPASAFRVRAVGCIGLTVASADRSAEFFTQVLGFTEPAPPVTLSGSEHEALEGAPGATRRARVDLGDECLELDEPLAGLRRPLPADSRSNDLWFQHVAIVVRDMDRAYEVLEHAHVPHASVAPQTLPAWNKSAAGIRAYYFKDPDGHTLEVLWFPPDKGLPRWHPATDGSLFLGIDHTAIASGNTAASLRFYQGLGFHVAGASENWGPEQERLNAVASAHLRITTLRAAAGPGIELLEYLTPAGGRPMPADDRGDDGAHWRTTLLPDGPAPPGTLRDPDGHLMEIHGS